MNKSAEISECGLYRFTLERSWDSSLGTCCWIMLNPSTADADVDDATVRKCVGFTKKWGFGRVVIVNLYAYRSRDPKALLRLGSTNGIPKAIGEGNNKHIVSQIELSDRVVCAWGNNAVRRRAMTVLDMDCLVDKPVYYLGMTKQRHPRHPLMPSYSTELEQSSSHELMEKLRV